MKNIDKIKLLEEILEDKDLVSKKILKEEEPEGKLIVSAEGESPEEAKKTIMEQLGSVDLPDEEDMEEVMDEEYGSEEEYEEDLDEDMLGEEDRDILEMLPEKTRCQFKKRLMEKIKSM